VYLKRDEVFARAWHSAWAVHLNPDKDLACKVIVGRLDIIYAMRCMGLDFLDATMLAETMMQEFTLDLEHRAEQAAEYREGRHPLTTLQACEWAEAARTMAKHGRLPVLSSRVQTEIDRHPEAFAYAVEIARNALAMSYSIL
jgi:hypothetical protein